MTMKTALLNLFQTLYSKAFGESLSLPLATRPGFKIVPSMAIVKANEIVSKVLEQSLSSGEREPYLKLTPTQRYQIGKRLAMSTEPWYT